MELSSDAVAVIGFVIDAIQNSEFFRIGLPDSDRCKHPCLVSAAWMQRVQAVLLQLPTIDNGMLAIGQLHLVRA